MEAKSRLVLVAAVVLAAGTAALWFAAGRSDEMTPAPAPGVPASAPRAPAAVEAASVRAEATAPTPNASTAPAATPARSEVAVPAAKQATLRGRCVDAAGEPLAACTVQVKGWAANRERMDQWLGDHGIEPEWHAPGDVATGPDGTFAVAFWPPPPYQFMLEVQRDGCATMSGRWTTLAEDCQIDVGDVAMTPGVRVTGRVVDATGAPVESESVTLHGRASEAINTAKLRPRWGEQAVSGPDGKFAARGWLHVGEYELSTQKHELQSPKSLTLGAERPDEAITVVVAKLPARPTITGRVLDEAGAPVRGVEIRALSGVNQSRAQSGPDGTFQLRQRGSDLPPSALLTVTPGTYDGTDDKPRPVDWGATDVEIRVARAGALTLRVTDPQQAPVESYTVRLIPQNRSYRGSEDSRVRAQGKHEDGTVVLDGLTRGEWLLLVDFPVATGFDSLFAQFTHEDGARRVDLRATAAAARTVRVVTSDAAPVAGTKVRLVETFDRPLDEARFVMPRDHWLQNPGQRNALVLDEGTTGADGRVTLRGPGGRALGICVLGPGHVPCRESGVRINTAEELVVRVRSGARFQGKIVPPEALVELARLANGATGGSFGAGKNPRLAFADDQGTLFPKDQVVAACMPGLRLRDDGSFEVEGLPPGTWQVRLLSMIAQEGSGISVEHSFPTGQVTLVDGQTTTRDLDLTHVLPGTLAGLVLRNGLPMANETVNLATGDGRVSVRTDGQGRFEKLVFAGTYTLSLNRQLQCPTPARVERGQTTTMTFALSSTKVKVIVHNAAGAPVRGAQLHALGAAECGAALPPTDDAGVATTELTSESVVLRILPKALASPEAQRQLWQEAKARGDKDPFARHWISLQTVVLSPGQSHEFEVRLPADSGY